MYRSHIDRCFPRFTLLAILAAIAAVSPAGAGQTVASQQAAASVDADFRQRLDTLINRLEAARAEHHVPGMALAVVKDDKLVLARGFGHANLEQNELVTPHTTFAIGSCSKAFTAALIGMLVDEGKMNWEDPLEKHLPYFRLTLDSDEADAKATLIDALAHRTGYTRMSALIMAPEPTNELRLRTAIGAEPWDGFRRNFHYTNIMYIAAGECAVAANGDDSKDWHDLIHDRLLEPLSMVSARSRYTDIAADEALATPYLWKPALETFETLPVRNPDGVAAAGAITSNVIDMAQWLRLQLGRGTIDDTQMFSAASHEMMWKMHTDIAPDFGYGLGWMLEKWSGRDVVQHGGNIDGFSAMTAMIPEENLGFVLLMNVSFTPLQELCRSIVWDALLGDAANEDAGTEDYSDYVGEYLANFGTLRDATLTVLEKDGKLALDVPGQMAFELKPPDDEGKWYFALTDQVAISFERDDDGEIVALTMHQAGLRLEAPRKGVEIAPPVPLGELQKYLGRYHSDVLDRTDTVVIQNNRLAIDIPGQMVFELDTPSEDGLWVFRATDAISAKFTADDEGRITQLTLYQGGQEFPMSRVDAAPDPLPTVDDVLALRGSTARRNAILAAGTTHTRAVLDIRSSGVKGEIETWAAGFTRARTRTDMGIWGNSDAALDGDIAEERSTFQPYQRHLGVMLEQAKLGHPHTLIGPLMDSFDSLRVTELTEHDDRPCIVIEATRGELPAWRLLIDRETGDVLRARVPMVLEGIGTIPIDQRFSDYRVINGLRVPFRGEIRSDMGGLAVMEVESFETNVEVDESRIFRLGPSHVYD